MRKLLLIFSNIRYIEWIDQRLFKCLPNVLEQGKIKNINNINKSLI